MNSALMNIYIQVYLEHLFSAILGYMPRSKIAGSYGNYVYVVEETTKLV